jgi:hypothetical protein
MKAGVGSGAALLHAAFGAFQHQREAQRDRRIDRIGAGGGVRELLLDMTSCRTRSAIFRQMLNQFARVGERAQRHHRGMTSVCGSCRDQSGRTLLIRKL